VNKKQQQACVKKKATTSFNPAGSRKPPVYRFKAGLAGS
jgi:hypothetical protein